MLKHNQKYPHIKSSNVYWIDPKELRGLGVEKYDKNRDNAFKSHWEWKDKTQEERAGVYDLLKNIIKRKGFDPHNPIEVLLNRHDNQDKLWQGHHRLAIAIELGLDKVPVRFVYEDKQYALRN